MDRAVALLLVGWLALAQPVWAEPLYEFGVNLRARMRMDNNRNANLLLYSQFGEYSSVHLALRTENQLNFFFSQKLQNFDRTCDPEEVEQAFASYEGRGWRVWVGKMWMPFGQGMGERELAKGVQVRARLWKENTLQLAVANNGERRQKGIFCRFGSRSLGASIAYGENLGTSKAAFRFVRGEDYEPIVGKGYGLLLGVDVRQIAGITLWQAEAILARNGLIPDADFLIVQASIRLPAGLNPVVRAEANTRSRDLRWLVSVEQPMGGGLVLYPQVVFRRADFEQANIELRMSF